MAYLDTIAHKRIGVLGLGVSGLACVSFLMKFRIKPFVMDGNPESHGLKAVKSGWPEIKVSQQLPQDVDLLIVSPGIPLASDLLVEAKQRGIEIIGDVELFARINNRPVIAITGSNGKSTVTKLVTQILQNAGVHAVMGGNIGVPVLSLLASPFDVAVLELSSFQLETTQSLQSRSASILNCVEDHMDRYDSFDSYVAAKQRIYENAEMVVYNRHDESTNPTDLRVSAISFGLDAPIDNNVGVIENNFVAEQKVLCPTASFSQVGQHNRLNALAAIALVAPFGVTDQVIEQTFKQFRGLPHRCELLDDTGDILWVNDSKATNVGATVAAIKGIAPQCQGKLILIAGGVGKSQDFSPLKAALEQYVSHLITFGQDSDQINRLAADAIAVESLQTAVEAANKLASAGDLVLLSPACASQDMFVNFEQRGEQFGYWVREVSHVD